MVSHKYSTHRYAEKMLKFSSFCIFIRVIHKDLDNVEFDHRKASLLLWRAPAVEVSLFKSAATLSEKDDFSCRSFAHSLIYEIRQDDALLSPLYALQSIAEFLRKCHDSAAYLIRTVDKSHVSNCEFCLLESSLHSSSSLNLTNNGAYQETTSESLKPFMLDDSLDAAAAPATSSSPSHNLDNSQNHWLETLSVLNSFEGPRLLHTKLRAPVSSICSVETKFYRVPLMPPSEFRLQALLGLSTELDAFCKSCHEQSIMKAKYFGGSSFIPSEQEQQFGDSFGTPSANPSSILSDTISNEVLAGKWSYKTHIMWYTS